MDLPSGSGRLTSPAGHANGLAVENSFLIEPFSDSIPPDIKITEPLFGLQALAPRSWRFRDAQPTDTCPLSRDKGHGHGQADSEDR